VVVVELESLEFWEGVESLDLLDEALREIEAPGGQQPR